jgi:hypothetical protein
MKGQPKETGWIDPKSKLPRLWTTVKGALERRGLILWVLYFNSPAMRDVLARLRKHETKLKWQVTDAGGRHYFDHLDSYTRKPVLRGRRIVVEWAPRSSHRPDHLLDCELMQLAAAMLRGRLPWSYSPPRRGEEITLA